jgi:hypothetical protein
MHALDATSGEIAWQFTQGPVYAATSYTNGVVFNGALDSIMHVYDAELGVPLAALPAEGPISSGPAIVGDWVFFGGGTSSSDLCAKDQPYSDACFAVFESVLGAQGGVHAYALLTAEPVPGDGQVDERSDPPDPHVDPVPDPELIPDLEQPTTPGTGGGLALAALAVMALGGAVLAARRRV